MINKRISLRQLTNLASDMNASEAYLRYAAGLGNNHQFRPQEVEGARALIELLGLADEEGEGFLYSYSLPRLNKEFDLLKVGANHVIDIELKRQEKPIPDMRKQLIQNRHYLRLLHKETHLFMFISYSKKVFRLDGEEFREADPSELKEAILLENSIDIDLDKEFSSDKILVSPIKNPNRFACGDYLLTEHQESIKRQMWIASAQIEPPYFIGLTGAQGTGKTLLLYDLAKAYGKTQKVLILLKERKTKGHEELEALHPTFRILPFSKATYEVFAEANFIFVDSAHSLKKAEANSLEQWVNDAKKPCFLFFDPDRKPYDEEEVAMVQRMQNLCKTHLFRLSFRVRVNKEMARFIACMRDLSQFSPIYRFDHIHLTYEGDASRAMAIVKKKKEEGFAYIPLVHAQEGALDPDEEPIMQTYEAMGQEYEKVVLVFF